MKCSNEVVFKGIDERAAGVFKNQNGQDISYPKAYVVRFDEEVDGDYVERKVKFDGSNTVLYNRFKGLKCYDRINITFDVALQSNSCKISIADFGSALKK